jgi:GTP-binding protein HflX
VRDHRETQRRARQRAGIPIFAIIGYTNAGKSTLLNALTEAGVFTEDKLFATLDTTTRKYTLANQQPILLVDTVGLIRKLPHLLVAAFKSTLEEALQADILIHLIDASHPMAEEQAATTLEVLKQLGAHERPILTVFNKVDLPSAQEQLLRLRLQYCKGVAIAAKEKIGFEQLEEAMERELAARRRILKLSIPQSDYGVIASILRQGTVLQQEYVEDNVEITAEVPMLLGEQLQRYVLPS